MPTDWIFFPLEKIFQSCAGGEDRAGPAGSGGSQQELLGLTG